jgi:hypothetical protein
LQILDISYSEAEDIGMEVIGTYCTYWRYNSWLDIKFLEDNYCFYL